MKRRCRSKNSPRAARGIVLVVCLVVIALVSIAAAISVRNAGSAESGSGGARTRLQAFQAAEAALASCERSWVRYANGLASDPVPAAAPPDADTPMLWEDLAYWDGPASLGKSRIVPFADSDAGGPYLRRPPECMVQYTEPGRTDTVVVTARGFGPEARAADRARSPPDGAEVWLQSFITLRAGSVPGVGPTSDATANGVSAEESAGGARSSAPSAAAPVIRVAARAWRQIHLPPD